MPPVQHPIFARIYARFSAAAEKAGNADHRAELLAGTSGRVIEVGAGNGLNFAHYPETVDEVVAVEPEPYLRDRATEEAERVSVPVTVVDGTAEELPADDNTFDVAVASLVLCSVHDQGRALAEIHRVLRPGGELRFYEHVRSRDRRLARAQDLADRTFWPRVAGGGPAGRDSRQAIVDAGLEIRDQRRFPFKPCPLAVLTAPHVIGRARKGLPSAPRWALRSRPRGLRHRPSVRRVLRCCRPGRSGPAAQKRPAGLDGRGDGEAEGKVGDEPPEVGAKGLRAVPGGKPERWCQQLIGDDAHGCAGRQAGDHGPQLGLPAQEGVERRPTDGQPVVHRHRRLAQMVLVEAQAQGVGDLLGGDLVRRSRPGGVFSFPRGLRLQLVQLHADRLHGFGPGVSGEHGQRRIGDRGRCLHVGRSLSALRWCLGAHDEVRRSTRSASGCSVVAVSAHPSVIPTRSGPRPGPDSRASKCRTNSGRDK
jgi:ubiquinone/menaquinone biosynthesis C-methylase UbiE